MSLKFFRRPLYEYYVKEITLTPSTKALISEIARTLKKYAIKFSMFIFSNCPLVRICDAMIN